MKWLLTIGIVFWALFTGLLIATGSWWFIGTGAWAVLTLFARERTQ